MLVSELMTTQVQTIDAPSSMKAAADLMSARDIGCLPIVDEERRLVGIVTDRDICLAAAARGEALSRLGVRGRQHADARDFGHGFGGDGGADHA